MQSQSGSYTDPVKKAELANLIAQRDEHIPRAVEIAGAASKDMLQRTNEVKESWIIN